MSLFLVRIMKNSPMPINANEYAVGRSTPPAPVRRWKLDIHESYNTRVRRHHTPRLRGAATGSPQTKADGIIQPVLPVYYALPKNEHEAQTAVESHPATSGRDLIVPTADDVHFGTVIAYGSAYSALVAEKVDPSEWRRELEAKLNIPHPPPNTNTSGAHCTTNTCIRRFGKHGFSRSEFETALGLERASKPRPHFATTFAKLDSFDSAPSQQHVELLRDIERDELLVKRKQQATEALHRSAAIQVHREAEVERRHVKEASRKELLLAVGDAYALAKLKTHVLEASAKLAVEITPRDWQRTSSERSKVQRETAEAVAGEIVSTAKFKQQKVPTQPLLQRQPAETARQAARRLFDAYTPETPRPQCRSLLGRVTERLASCHTWEISEVPHLAHDAIGGVGDLDQFELKLRS